jgi:hypothetical protein
MPTPVGAPWWEEGRCGFQGVCSPEKGHRASRTIEDLHEDLTVVRSIAALAGPVTGMRLVHARPAGALKCW